MLIDHTGQTFGKWSVLKRAENNKFGQAQWLCRCDCGAEHVVCGTDLRRGVSKGCVKCAVKGGFVDLSGSTFGSWTVLERAESSDDGQARWVCRCSCGRSRKISSYQLTQGKSTRCGVCARNVRLPDEEVSYALSHARLRFERGPASEHLCADCGGPAAQWSYVYGDPNELTGSHGNVSGLAYSANLDFYVARCAGCHAAFDREHRELVSKEANRPC